jgi:hypothetical protein
MNEIVAGMVFATALFVGMLVLLEVGRRLRQRHRAQSGGDVGAALGAVGGAVFGLLGLLVAFTFSGAATRFDARRHLIVDEANAIGTAYARLDLLPPEPRRALQRELRQYVDARLALYRAIPDSVKVRAALAQAATLRQEIWQEAVPAVQEAPNPQLAGQLLPALNAMSDIATSRLAATQIHPHPIIFALLGMVALVSALLAGYAMAESGARSWLHAIAFAAVLAITVYVIVDLEYPRLGLFQVAEFDQLLVDVRASMR